MSCTIVLAPQNPRWRSASIEPNPASAHGLAGAKEANRRALAWAEQSLAALLVGEVRAVVGPVILHALA
jgi:hypothetical protein